MYFKIARSLASDGHAVIIIAPKSSTYVDIQGISGEPKGSIQLVEVTPSNNFMQRFCAVFRLIRLGLKERAAVYIAPEPESWVAALGIKLLGGGKVILDMHEHIPGEFAKFFPVCSQSVIAWITTKVMRLFARFTDLIILTRDSFEVFWSGLKTPRITIINTNHLQPPCTHIPEFLEKAFLHRPTMIHHGIFGDIRGSYQLLDAMKQVTQVIPEACCILLGRYCYGDKEAYVKAIQEAKLENAIVMFDEVPFESVPPYIAVSRIGLILFQPGLANHVMAMPHKLFDYMREARPVIAPEFSVEIASIVREANCGLLVDVTSPNTIAEAMVELLANPEKAALLGKNGRQLVQTKYNWQHEEGLLLKAIRRLE